ncbi:hypothetical protein BS17DRAFT_778935 [Gyrodon lividus]|nr:hypothetical protein BS17DRAFT_778935 [Gyrodon lividus]
MRRVRQFRIIYDRKDKSKDSSARLRQLLRYVRLHEHLRRLISMSSHSMDHSQEHSQKKRQSKVERIRNALAIVRDGSISFIDFLSQILILDPSEKEFKAYRTAIYSVDDNSPPKLYRLFDLILDDPDRFFIAG